MLEISPMGSVLVAFTTLGGQICILELSDYPEGGIWQKRNRLRLGAP